ncbi:MAG: DUF423 domain-containing protein [Gammaproteobacteria bacterium]|nr:DUF423 domain-containing protein [Gammaproteobacteria bacterium]MDD9959174.1 DUF423 domain-containing protein [Gammaproteobacteria bacterium]
MPIRLLIFAATNGFLAVGLGAFAAHGLESIMAADLLETFGTGVEYHMYHSLAALGTAALAFQFPEEKLLGLAGNLFLLGILFFSGSLYLLSLSGIRWLGAITPIGGLFFLAAWATLIRFAINIAKQE